MIRTFTKPVKSQSKDTVSFLDYIEFSRNDDFKFEFYFLYVDELGNYNCKCKGEIKYIIFD